MLTNDKGLIFKSLEDGILPNSLEEVIEKLHYYYYYFIFYIMIFILYLFLTYIDIIYINMSFWILKYYKIVSRNYTIYCFVINE